MYSVNIQIANNQQRFTVGDTVSGTAEVTAPVNTPLSDVSLSFHCLGEVKWIEYVGTPHYLNSHVYYDKIDFHEEVVKVDESHVKTVPEDIHKKLSIPFAFKIPDDKDLPSTMISTHGFVKYYVRVTIKHDHTDTVKKFIKEVIVLAPLQKNLMITVGGSGEKSVLLHNGTVAMHASIGRKGFAPGETITVHATVDNKTNTKVTPRVTLTQVQIFMCGARHKTIESLITKEPVVGSEIAPHSQVEEVLNVTIPNDDSLSIKSSVITVKYFLQVTLDIPHSFDLHVNLPVVVTSKQVIDQLRAKEDALVAN